MAYSMHCALPSRSYFEALETAEKRALHSFFDQHVIEDDELGYFALDEGGRSTIYRWMAEGRFPKPVQLGGYAVAWAEEEIETWISDRLQ